MQSSNLIKIILISCFTLLSIGCSNGDKDSGGNDTWSPQDIEELRREAKNYKPMSATKYKKPEVMQARDEYIQSLFTGDVIPASFAALLNNPYMYGSSSAMEGNNYDPLKDKEFLNDANMFIETYLDFSLDRTRPSSRPVVDHSKDLQTRHNDEDFFTTQSPYDGTSIIWQLTQVVGLLKKTQSTGESYWGERDRKRVDAFNQLIQQRREQEIDNNKLARGMGMVAVSTVGGFAFVILPRVFSRTTFKKINHFFSEATHRVLGVLQKTPLIGSTFTKGGHLTGKEILLKARPKNSLIRIPSLVLSHLTLSGDARIHFSNTLKIRHHLSNLFYSIKTKKPKRQVISEGGDIDESPSLSQIVNDRLEKGIENIAFNPRFRAASATDEDKALLYFMNAHRVSNNQYLSTEVQGLLYKEAMKEIDLSNSQRKEFIKKFKSLVREHPQVPQSFKDIAEQEEYLYLLSKQGYVPDAKLTKLSDKEFFKSDFSKIEMTDVVYTEAMLNRLLSLRKKVEADEKNDVATMDFLNKAIDLVYDTQKYDVLNISGMRMVLKKNHGQVEKVFVGRPLSTEASTTYELKTVAEDVNDVKPMVESDMSQEEFLKFMDKTVRKIREGKVLDTVVGNGRAGYTPVGYSSLTKKVGPDKVSKGFKKDFGDIFNTSKNTKDGFRKGLAGIANKRVSIRTRIDNFRHTGTTQKVTKSGLVWVKDIMGKPENIDSLTSMIDKNIDNHINSFVKKYDELTDTRVEKLLELDHKLAETQSNDLRVRFYNDAMEKRNEYPFASTLKKDMNDKALNNPHLTPEDLKDYLKQRAPIHIEAHKENLEVLKHLLHDQEFVSQYVKYLQGHPDSVSHNLSLALRGEWAPNLSEEEANKRILIEMYHSINDTLSDKTKLIKDSVGGDGQLPLYKLYEKESMYWIPTFYDRNLKGVTKWSDNKLKQAAVVIGSIIGTLVVTESFKPEILGVDVNSGIFIDDSVNAMNWQSLTESSEYRDFEEIATEQRTGY